MIKKLFTGLLALTIAISLYSYHICTCDHCHEVQAEIVCPKCGKSDAVSEQNRTNPTCDTDGSITYYCRNNHSDTATTVDTYTWTVTISKLGHNWRETNREEATCTETGLITYTCTTCGRSYDEEIAVLGHSYKVETIKEVTCEEDGLKKYTCSRCQKSYEKVVTKLGHNYQETENVPATCTEDGHITRVCKNCNDEQIEVLKAFGHKVELKTTKEPTCTETGEKSGICEICGSEIKEEIPAKGHDYPEEWTVTKESSIFSSGEKQKICTECGTIETEEIPKEEIPPAVPVAAVGGTSALAAIFFILKKKATKKVGEKVVKDITKDVVEDIAKEALEPSFEDRTIVTCIENDAFYKAMKAQKHLSIVESEYNEIAEAISENEPDLTIIDVSKQDIEEVKANIEEILAENEETLITLLLTNEQLKNHGELLEQMKEDAIIYNYSTLDTNASVNLVKLVLPIMKPDLKSDEGLENIGMVADVLNIPFVSTVIGVYTSGREIKETIEGADEEGLGVVDKATIISDIASILGLDTISSVAGLVGDVDDIKSSFEAKVGGSEVSTTKDAIEDIVDVVSEIIDK